MPVNNESPLLRHFLHFATHQPSLPALHIGNSTFSYGELHAMASSVYSQIPESPSRLIGIYCLHSEWTYAAIIAVILKGHCYVPLNPKLPAKRLSELCISCNLQEIVSESPLPFPYTGTTILLNKQNIEKVTECKAGKNAYLIFTSGSTGKPKPVLITNENADAFFSHVLNEYKFGSNDRFIQPYELNFDMSVFVMFSAWNAGACLYVVPEGMKYLNILKTLRDHHITVSSLVPTTLFFMEKFLPEFNLPFLRYSFFAGDRLFHRHALLWKSAASQTRIINSYGPTETTIVCTSYDWNETQSEKESLHGVVPLGKPFPNMQYVLRKEDGSLSHAGPAELCLHGPQVFQGGDDGKEIFITVDGKMYYRTGDIASVNTNGNLMFHGRNDGQVKIQGYRIETGEVAHAIERIAPGKVVVIAVATGDIQTLVAFVESRIAATDILVQLSEVLPAYMLPSEIIQLKEFPVTANGKIDHNELKRQYHAKHAAGT